jgi:hypothetical protein
VEMSEFLEPEEYDMSSWYFKNVLSTVVLK